MGFTTTQSGNSIDAKIADLILENIAPSEKSIKEKIQEDISLLGLQSDELTREIQVKKDDLFMLSKKVEEYAKNIQETVKSDTDARNVLLEDIERKQEKITLASEKLSFLKNDISQAEEKLKILADSVLRENSKLQNNQNKINELAEKICVTEESAAKIELQKFVSDKQNKEFESQLKAREAKCAEREKVIIEKDNIIEKSSVLIEQKMEEILKKENGIVDRLRELEEKENAFNKIKGEYETAKSECEKQEEINGKEREGLAAKQYDLRVREDMLSEKVKALRAIKMSLEKIRDKPINIEI